MSTLPTACRRISAGAVLCALAAWAQAPARSVWSGVYTEAQAERGQVAYNAECARCHGTQLQGGESAPPLAGIDFLANWNGLTVADLFERIRVSMPADRPGRLPREQNADIIAYMLRASEFPAGPAELAPRAEALRDIRVELSRPNP